MMSLEERLDQALNECDLISIKAHLTSFIDKYPRNENNAVVEAFELACSRCPHLAQPHDGEPLLSERSSWNIDYLATLMDDLIDNFSTERFEHTIEVSAHLHEVKYASSEDTLEDDEELFTLPPRQIDYSGWVLLIVAAIIFMVVFHLIRGAL